MTRAKKKSTNSRKSSIHTEVPNEVFPNQDQALSHEVRPQRVLIAEDNKVTQGLLKLLLNQRGHQVDIVGNGEDALTALEKDAYDVVLMDFHLPKMDGLKVATTFRIGHSTGAQPRFVAITADMEGLLGHVDNCENFDSILPKPFDLERVCQVVEGEAEEILVPCEAPAVTPTPDLSMLERQSKNSPVSAAANHIQNLQHAFLRWPNDFDGARLSDEHLQAALDDAGRFDAVLVCEAASPLEMTMLWSTKSLHVLPVIDLTGTLGAHADLDGANLSFGEADKIAELINDFHNQRIRLHSDVLYTDDLSVKLLGRAYVSGRTIAPRYDPHAAGLVNYSTVLESAMVEAEAAKLCQMGYLERTFFDRFHVCGACESSRLHIREECGQCRSSNLREEAYLHHFTCAYQGPESDFRQGDMLMCPKCRQELSHFSVDYDKPGTLLKCDTCHHADSEPLIGFVCLDCQAHADSDTQATRDAYSYQLTDRGVGYLETGRAMLGRQNRALRLAHLPLEIIVAVNAELKDYHEHGTPFAVLDVSYANQNQIEREHGVREFEQARDLFLENLNNTLRKEDQVIKGIAYDYAILKDVHPDEASDGVEYLRSEAAQGLRRDLGVTVQIFTPEDFA